MNILCVEQFSNWGGGQHSLIDLLPAFSAREWRCQIVVPCDGPFPERLHEMGYETIHLNSGVYSSTYKSAGQLWQYACEFPRLYKLLREASRANHTDLFYVNGPRFLPPAASAARRAGTPLVFHSHCRLMQRTAIALAGESLRLSGSHLIGCCHHAVEPIKRYVPKSRSKIIYNGVDAVHGSSARVNRPLIRIGVVGRIEPEKGQLDFVQAVKLIQSRFSECRFSIIGSPMLSTNTYYDQVLAAIRGTSIELLGWQNDMARIYSALDLLVVPSSPLESTTRVILEAYAAGVPVVAYPSGGIPEVVKDGETGFLAMGSSPASLAERMSDVLSMPRSELHTVVTHASRAWRERYSLDIYRAQICGMLAGASGCPTFNESCAAL